MKVDLMTLILFPIVCLALVLNQGWALSLTWNLFVPQFFGLPYLPVAIAIGMVYLFSLMSISNYKKPEEFVTTGEKVASVAVPFVSPWFCYLIVLIATSFYF